LIIHTLLVPNDKLIVAVAQVALAAPYHHWNPAQIDLLLLIPCDLPSSPVSFSLLLDDLDVYFGIDIVC
jgi:hypothetical protein